MKYYFRKLLLVIASSPIIMNVHPNNTRNLEGFDYNAGAFYNVNSVSPNVADMFRYGEFQTSLFTGRMHQSIPIYTLDDPDFRMDIALHYNAEGFKPRKHSGYVGYNWFLEAGGCITREVNGAPDEIKGIEAGASYHVGVEGMYHFITQNTNANNLNLGDVFELPLASNSQACVLNGKLWHNVGDGCDYVVDYMPDIFHFNFLGHRGSFMINNAGKVQIISGDFVDVDLSGILCEWDPIMFSSASFNPSNPSQAPNNPGVLPYPKENSSITIKTNDGYTYIFGGDISKLEYTVSAINRGMFVYSGSEYEANPAIVSTWHLSKIIAPNGREVTFYYKLAREGHRPGVPGGGDPLWEFNEYFDRFGPYFNMMAGIYWQIFANNASYVFSSPYEEEEYLCLLTFYDPPYTHNNSYYLYSATKSCCLDSILVSGEQPLRIVFCNSQETTKMYNSTDYGICSHNYQLDSVLIYASDEIIKNATMTYEYQGRSYSSKSYKWRFLSSLKISGVGMYQMNYNNGTYPDLSNTNPNYDPLTGLSTESDDYGYYVGYSSIALLQKLTYPTGGYQTYSYQPYSYDKKRKYTVLEDSNISMSTTNESGNKKGVRIHEVKTYDRYNHLVETKSYTYSDGIYYDNLRVYNLAENLYPETGWPIRYDANYNLLETHIGYGKVVENVTNASNSSFNKTIYQFDTGDDSYTSQNDENINERYYCENRKFGILEGQLLYGNQLKKWGKVTSIEYNKSGDTSLKSIHYKYNDITSELEDPIGNHVISPEQICTDTIVIFDCDYGVEMSKKLYIYPDVLTQKITKDFNQGDSLTTTKTYSYDRKLRVKKETIDDSQGIRHFTKYTYPDDFHFSIWDVLFDPPAVYQLRKKHRINIPVEQVSGYVENGEEYITSGIANLYENIWVIEKFNSNAAHIPVRPVSDSINLHIFDSINNNHIDVVDYYPYLYKTLSLALTEPIPVSNYQWMSTNGSNIIYDPHYKFACEYRFNLMDRPTLIKPFGKIETKYTWNGIYPATKTIGNQTWTYTYKPHVGLETVTDPRGIITYYNYDSAGRLIEEYQLVNGQKRVINVYQYHVKTE